MDLSHLSLTWLFNAAGALLVGGATIAALGSALGVPGLGRALGGELARLWGALLAAEGVLVFLASVAASDPDVVYSGMPWGALAAFGALGLGILPVIAVARTRAKLRARRGRLARRSDAPKSAT